MKRTVIYSALCLLVLGALLLSPDAWAMDAFKTQTIDIDGHPFKVEVAQTPEQHARGLQFRTRLDETRGMIFLFDQPQVLNFWMKDCKIPLDMLFFRDGRLVQYVDAAPPCTQPAALCPTYGPQEPTDTVVELKAGTRQKSGFHQSSLLHAPFLPVQTEKTP